MSAAPSPPRLQQTTTEHLSSRTRHSKSLSCTKMKQKQSQPEMETEQSMTPDLCDQNGKRDAQKEDKLCDCEAGQSLPADPNSPVGRGWVLPSAAPLHAPLTSARQKKSPLPSLPPLPYQLELQISCMPDFSPELCSLRERSSSISIMPTICPLNIQKSCSIIANYSNLLWLWCDSRALQNEKKTTEYWRKSKAPFLDQG